MRQFPFGLVVVWALIGLIDFRASEKFKKKNGVTPWHWPSWVWAFVGFVLGLLSAVPMLIATRTTKPRSAGQPAYPAVESGATSVIWAAPDRMPASVAITVRSSEGAVTVPSGQQYQGQATHPPAWLDDPTGRFASRYWNGSRWTEDVSDGSSTATDPI